MNSNLTKLMVSATAVVALGVAGNVIAQDEMNDIGAVTCRDILLASGEDRDAVVLVLHAWILGEAKQLKYDPNELADATDRFMDACIADPDSKALSTMQAQLKSDD